MNALVSIIVPAYNMARFTEETVESLLDQSHPHLEIIVIDDGSTDNTGEVLERFSERITYVYQENRGACSARNHGFLLSKGDFVAFLDCDDTYHPEKVERFLEKFRARPDVGMIYSPEYLIDEDNRVIGINSPRRPPTGRVFPRLLNNNFIGSSTPVIRREAFERAGKWDEAIFTTADWEMWLRVSRSCEIDFINEPLSSSRQVSLYNQRNVEKTEREACYVLEKLRKEGVASKKLRAAKSNVDILLHRYAFENKRYRDSLGYLSEAIAANPFQLKAYAHLTLSAFSRPLYRAILQRKRRAGSTRHAGLGGETP